MSTSAGRVMPLPKGAYDAGTTYHVLDIVSFNNSSYICKQTSQGNLPTNTTYWQLIASGSAVGSLDDIGDVTITSAQDGDVLVRRSSLWVNEPAPSTGLKPHIVVSTTTGSTVTLTKRTTTINATETSSGVYEADVPDYGTWTATATLSGQTATASVSVDTVKVYNVNCNYFSATITVTYPAGSTCTLSATGQSTQTATQNPQAFVVHATGTYTITATDGVATSTQTVTITTDGQTESVTLTFFTATITATYPAGATCTLSATGQSTQTADTNPYTFTVHAAATYTITATDGGDTASDTVTITTDGQSESVTLSFVPDGSTVTPTDDIQTWLACGGVTGKSYTTLNEVLADTSTLYTLIYGNNNANDYLVRSTTWASDACSDSNFMTYVGANNYASNTLLADADWLEAIVDNLALADGTVLNVKNPVMTNNTTPEGECFANNSHASYPPYKAFDGDTSSLWETNRVGTIGDNVGYDFGTSKKIYVVAVTSRYYSASDPSVVNYKVQGYGSDWVDVTDTLSWGATTGVQTKKHIITSGNYQKMRIYNLSSFPNSGPFAIFEMQIYGREDV